MNLRPRSVRVRLTLWYACALAATLAVFSISVYSIVRASLLRDVEERAEQSLSVIQRLLIDNPSEPDEIEEHDIVQLFALLRNGAPSYTSTAWQRQNLPEPLQLAAGPPFRRFESDRGEHYVLANSSIQIVDDKLTILVAVDESAALAHLRTLGLVLFLGLLASIAVSISGGLFLARRALSPVAAMASAASHITADRLSDRLPIENTSDEFGRLASVFNHTLARLQDTFDRLRRFTADASHELRTPLTALRSVGEVALHRPDFHEHCRDTIVSMLEESERLTQLVDGLLVLTRESTEVYRARFAPIDLEVIVHEVVDLFRVLAEEKHQRLDVILEDSPIAHGDRTTLRQALLNLVDNAIKYAPQKGCVCVRARTNGAEESIIEVTDDGPGIAEDQREKVFDRFYRVETDRSRATGGAGLGLAIARWAVELNGGQLELESDLGKGSTFRIRLPKPVTVATPIELVASTHEGS